MTVTAREERNHLIDLLVIAIDSGSMYGKSADHVLRIKLRSFSDSTIEIISQTAAWNRNQKNLRYRYMYSVLTECSEVMVREMMFHRPHFVQDINTTEAMEAIHGLHMLEYFKDTHPKLEDLTGRDLEVAKAYLNVTAALHEHAERESLTDGEGPEQYTMYINDKKLSDCIIAHPEMSEAMVRFIMDRNTGDSDLIRAYVQDGTALRDGIL